MIVAGPQRGGFETIFASFYLSFNEWWTVDFGNGGNYHQMRGVGCFLTLDQADLNLNPDGQVYPGVSGFKNWAVRHDPNGHVIGKSIWISGTAGGYTDKWFAYVGPLESAFWSGGPNQDGPAMARWVNVQIYGVHDQIYRTGGTATDEILWADQTTGGHSTASKEKAGGTMRLQGVLQITGNAATINLDGTAGAEYTWVVPASVDRSKRFAIGGAPEIVQGSGLPPGNRAIAGFNLRNTFYTDPYPVGAFNRTKGFICTMGVNVGRFS